MHSPNTNYRNISKRDRVYKLYKAKEFKDPNWFSLAYNYDDYTKPGIEFFFVKTCSHTWWSKYLLMKLNNS